MRSVTFKNLFFCDTYIFNYCKSLVVKKCLKLEVNNLNQLIIYKSFMYEGIYLFIRFI